MELESVFYNIDSSRNFTQGKNYIRQNKTRERVTLILIASY